eukprot:18414_1
MNESLTTNERTRLEIAQDSLVNLVRHALDKEDRFAIITYNDEVSIEYEMTLVNDLPYGMVDLRRAILALKPSGTTNALSDAYQIATNLFQGQTNDGTVNRIVFMTDLQLNLDKKKEYNSQNGIFDMIKNAALKKKIYTTFMSMGVEQDNNLLSPINEVQGCNYLTVHNKNGFMA